MKHFDDMIRQSLHESVENKDTTITFEQIENQNIKTIVKKKWINKMNVGIGSIAALLLVGLLCMNFIHPHTVDRSGKTPSNTDTSQTSVEQSRQTPSNTNTSQKTSNIDQKTYATLSKANSDFSHYQLTVPINGSKTMDLGSGIQAHYIYSSKYRTYEVTWTQKNWTVGFQTYGNEQSVQQEAKAIYNYLLTAKLPKANKPGVISFFPNSPFLPIVAWQDGKTIYSLKHTDPTWQGLNNLSSSNTSKTSNSTSNFKKGVSVTIDANAGYNQISNAIKKYLQKVSSPTLFKSFRIVKLTKGKAPSGSTLYTVKLMVYYQPGQFAAYNEGVNYRFVSLQTTSNGYVVTALGTGP